MVCLEITRDDPIPIDRPQQHH